MYSLSGALKDLIKILSDSSLISPLVVNKISPIEYGVIALNDGWGV
jgi:hypothetical protein